MEAKWCYNKYAPNFEEYMNNAWISFGGALVLVHSYFSLTNPINKEALDSLEKYPNIIRCSSMIGRLSNDLGPSNKVRTQSTLFIFKCFDQHGRCVQILYLNTGSMCLHKDLFFVILNYQKSICFLGRVNNRRQPEINSVLHA